MQYIITAKIPVTDECPTSELKTFMAYTLDDAMEIVALFVRLHNVVAIKEWVIGKEE